MTSNSKAKSGDGFAPSTGRQDPNASHFNSGGSSTAPPTTPSTTNALLRSRKTLIPPPNIVVTPADTNLKAKRRLSSDSEGDASPQKEPATKRAKADAFKDDDRTASNGKQAPIFSSAIYPTPITAIFPPTPLTPTPPIPTPLIPSPRKDTLDYLDGDLDHFATTTPPVTPPKSKTPFQMLAEFMRHPELILNLAKVLHPTSLVHLYAISKPFHFIMNSHYTTYIKTNMDHHAPGSNLIFPWRCYGRLTIKDPGWRPKHASNPASGARDIPSLRWLQMVVYREEIVRDILTALSKYGLLLPHDIERAVKKMWFLCDLPGNASRIGVLHNTGYFHDRDIFLSQMFMMKLDMRFTDPVEGCGETHLRRLFFGCRNFVPLRDFLIGRLSLSHLLQRIVWYQYNPTGVIRALQLPILGIANHQVGQGNTENWGRGTQRLLRVDEGIAREAIRRELNTHKHFIEFMLFAHQEMAVKQGGKSEMTQLKDLSATDLRAGRAERMKPFEFYIWGWKKNLKDVTPQEQQQLQLQVPSQQSTMAVIDDAEGLEGEEVEEGNSQEAGSSQEAGNSQ
ncbi:gtp cyclohydrolase i [Venturia nashicola]|uniref:Gtp cyclohydrolase i n=1 Tax=Venturia nashicola TaxID=86259 RepID=A0A4Z1PL73_9PEZI|nr:gtp cyclohydrolase i [Venturia nashicola]